MTLDQFTGRTVTRRRDAQATRKRLVDGAGTYVVQHGTAPTRLADVATHAGISTATAYRYFESIDDLVRAHVSRLPEDAVERFSRSIRAGDDPVERLHRWNRAWVGASLAYAASAVQLRSSEGFLRRRRDGDAVVAYVCAQIEPLLSTLTADHTRALAVWNVASDPREVFDLRDTLGWSAERIARHITDVTLAAS